MVMQADRVSHGGDESHRRYCKISEAYLKDYTEDNKKEDVPVDKDVLIETGVIHAGVYYKPGSLKLEFCKRGATQTIAFCQEHDLPYEKCGKLLVATDIIEYERMEALEERCSQNGIATQRLSAEELKKIEPNIKGFAALLVPATGITDYRKITLKMAELFTALGGVIKSGLEVKALREEIIEKIKLSEENEGIDKDEIIMSLKDSQPEIINQEIQKLLEEGIIYEPKPGRVRYLG